ncbi:exported hypothetical protein [Brevundimonas sp. G8]|nr:exported hypothetical protein [Brevundimonas sp. G8]
MLCGTALAAGVIVVSTSANAQCAFPPAVGNDIYTCTSATSTGGLSDLVGDNSLLLPVGGSGTLNGSVVFGDGADRVEINSGTITGAVDQGAGRDSFVITGGAVLGGVQQGGGVDDFRMTGGAIQSLNQGDDFDTFFMSGGRIIDFFDDGDRAVMTGGRIGRVNMKLANNVFDMSGGIIDRNLVTGFGDDTIVISGGEIGGNISVSGGADSLTVTGGSVGGEVRMSVGNDSFVWDGGGIIYGMIDMGGDDDVAVLRNLTAANMGRTPAILGGEGDDGLTLDNVTSAGVARFQGWESVYLTNDTELTMDGALVLGDAGSGTGVLSIDATSTLFGGGLNGSISPFLNGSLARVVNAGRIDLTNGAAGAGDRFTITGDFVGADGLVLLDTVLGDDSSASDRLVILGGSASGTTSLSILNRGGVGASTAVDGIMVVEAANGASTAGGAFALNGRVAAGAFEYFLFRGGVSQGTTDNWYLRSTVVTPPPSVPAPQPAPAPPPLEPPVPAPPPQPPEPPAPPVITKLSRRRLCLFAKLCRGAVRGRDRRGRAGLGRWATDGHDGRRDEGVSRGRGPDAGPADRGGGGGCARLSRRGLCGVRGLAVGAVRGSCSAVEFRGVSAAQGPGGATGGPAGRRVPDPWCGGVRPGDRGGGASRGADADGGGECAQRRGAGGLGCFAGSAAGAAAKPEAGQFGGRVVRQRSEGRALPRSAGGGAARQADGADELVRGGCHAG